MEYKKPNSKFKQDLYEGNEFEAFFGGMDQFSSPYS